MGFIFDMGNVLALRSDVIPLIAKELGIPVQRILEFSRDDFSAFLIGKGSTEEYWKSFNRVFHTDVREDLLITRFHPETDARVKQLIIDLKAAGRRVVCGTNAFEKHYLYNIERGDYEVFDAVYASNVIGIAKPSEAFFQHILRQEGWPARDTFFIDDGAENVAAAAGMGMRAFHYQSLPPLLAWLAGNGVLPAG